MTMPMVKRLLPLPCSLILTSCGTLYALSTPGENPNQIYAGTRAAAQGHMTQIDVPFSLIADTIVLPYTIPRTIYDKRHPTTAPTQPPPAAVPSQ